MKNPIDITDLEFENGQLVKVRGARPEYFDGHTLINLVREMACAWRGFVEVIAARQIVELNKTTPSVVLTYTNYRGETAERRIIPFEVWFGSTEWHPEPQWLLRAYDCEKKAERDFALKDFGARVSDPNSHDPTDVVGLRDALADAGLSFERTNRGFSVSRFVDLYGSVCSLQASSIADIAAIWLGVDKHFSSGRGERMHLTQAMVRDLLPALVRFVETGDLEPAASATSPSGGYHG